MTNRKTKASVAKSLLAILLEGHRVVPSRSFKDI